MLASYLTQLLFAWLAALGASASLLVIVWMYSVSARDASLVDRFWGVLFLVGALAVTLQNGSLSSANAAVILVVAAWGTRLSLYITMRNFGKGEDRRYKKMRADQGRLFPFLSLVTVFALQALLASFVGLSVFSLVMTTTAHVRPWLLGVGLVIAVIGVVYESVADEQLRRFLRDDSRRGTVCRDGLWRYSRHPNYFGESLVWWGFYLAACSRDFGFLTFVSPLVMTFLLLKVSGVAMLERDIKERRRGYAEYVATTNAFIPGPLRATTANTP